MTTNDNKPRWFKGRVAYGVDRELESGQVVQHEVGAVEQHVGGDVGRLDLLAHERDVDDAEGGDDALVGYLHRFLGGHSIGRARTARRHVDLPAGSGAATDDLPLLEPAQVPGVGNGLPGRLLRFDQALQVVQPLCGLAFLEVRLGDQTLRIVRRVAGIDRGLQRGARSG